MVFRALQRIHYSHQILVLYHTVTKRKVLLLPHSNPQTNARFSTNTLEIVLDTAIQEKQYSFVDLVWSTCTSEERNRWGMSSRYAHAMIADRRLKNARPFLQRIEREEYTIPVANSQVLQGLYEGCYYEECVKFFNGLLPLDSTFKLLGESRGVYSALLSAYELKRYKDVLSISKIASQLQFHPSQSVLSILVNVVFGLCAHLKIYEKADFWKPEYDRRVEKIKAEGKTPTELQYIYRLISNIDFWVSSPNADFLNCWKEAPLCVRS